MNSDDAFLRAIANEPSDDAMRLKYADWLDEQDDPRGELLHVQSELEQPPADKAAYRELCEREQELVKEVDPVWVQQVRRYTTAVPCRDMASLVPELVPFARNTTRLHPHRALAPLPAGVSKIGGRFLWPASESWPAPVSIETSEQ